MNIAVYCSSRENLPAEVTEMARQLGQWIGSHGHTLVYGGVNAGLMHIVAQATHDAGGHITGVIIKQFTHRGDALVDKMIVTADLNERKSRMIALSDVFVVLPGGVGTIDEWFATLSQLIVNQDARRGMIVANINGVFAPAMQQLQLTATSPFADNSIMRYIACVDSTEALINYLEKL